MFTHIITDSNTLVYSLVPLGVRASARSVFDHYKASTGVLLLHMIIANKVHFLPYWKHKDDIVSSQLKMFVVHTLRLHH